MVTRVAMLSVHTSPLAQPGSGDAGGMNVYVLELALALARRGVEVDIFTRATCSCEDAVVQVAPGVTVTSVVTGPFGGVAKADLAAELCAFIAEVLRIGASKPPGWYTCVHTHYWLSGQVGWLVAERWNVPLVHTMHTMARVKNAALAPGDAPEPLGRILGEEQVVGAARALIASTQTEADELISEYHALPERVHVIPPGVDLTAFTPCECAATEKIALRRELGVPLDRRIVLFVGRVQLLKGPDVLVRALPLLPADVDVVVLGGPSGRLTAVRELEALATIEGVRDRLHLRKPVSRGVLPSWYRAADLVAVPSYSESFGFVAAEAQACGVPVVAASVGGLKTVVVDGQTGLLIDGHDEAVWASTIAGLLADPARMAAMGSAGVAASHRFGWNSTAAATEAVYNSLTPHPRRVPH